MTEMTATHDGMRKPHNHCFDFFKGVACVCVVFMHCEFPGRLGIVVQAVSRFCVPFFFMLSGYYSYYGQWGRFNASRKIVHIAQITLLASLFYLLVAVARYLVFGESLFMLSRSVLLNWLVFNQPFVIPRQLWFLFALLYDYILFSLVYKMRLVKFATCMIAVLILAYVSLAQGAYLCGIRIPNMVYRNFLIEGFPFFMLGYWFHRNEGKVMFFNDSLLLVILCAMTVLCLLERKLMGRDFGVNISTYPQVACLFVIGMKHPEWFEGSMFSRLGKRFSMLVYVLHMFVWHMMDYAYAVFRISKNQIALYMKPVAVLGIAILFSYAVVFCTSKIYLHKSENAREMEMKS